jgi:hypothetical protein
VQYICSVRARYTFWTLIGRVNLAFVLLLSLAGRKYAVCCRGSVAFEGFCCVCCLFMMVPNLTAFGCRNQRKQCTGINVAESGFGLRWKHLLGPRSKGGPAKNLYTKSERMSVAEWLDWFVGRQIIDTTGKDKPHATWSGSRPLSSGNLYGFSSLSLALRGREMETEFCYI